MTRSEVLAALARLREAGRQLRRRPLREVHAALADVLDAWSAPDSRWQTLLGAALPAPTGFSEAVVREGLAAGLEPYTGRALLDLVRDELGEEATASGYDVTASVLAGAIPLPTFVAVVAPLALGSPVLVKPGAHDPVTAPLLARSLALRDAGLGACVEIAHFHRDDAAALAALCEAPCVAAMGSDAAIAAIAAQVGAGVRFIGSGQRFSLALLGPEATRGRALDRAAERLARDVALWDQLGCLSPVFVHVVDSGDGATKRVTQALASALDETERRLPRGRIGAVAAAAIARERAEAEMRAAAGRDVAVIASRGTEWTVVCESDPALRASPLHRFLRVHPVAGAGGALAALAPHGHRVAAVAVAGFGAATDDLAAALLSLGASRVCAPGALQTPPLAWPRDGEPVLRRLARRTSA